MRYAAGLLFLGLAGLSSGCVERLIVERDSSGSGSDSESTSSNSTSATDDSSTTQTEWNTDGVECNGPEDCGDNATCFEGVCVGTGELRISLSWAYITDLDLHVTTPSGVHISFESPNVGGGVLDVDDCVGGECLDNGGTHVENIYFPSQPPAGPYTVWVNNFDGINGGPFEIQVSGAATSTFTGSMPSSSTTSQVFTFEI